MIQAFPLFILVEKPFFTRESTSSALPSGHIGADLALSHSLIDVTYKKMFTLPRPHILPLLGSLLLLGFLLWVCATLWSGESTYIWEWRRALRYVGFFGETGFVAGPLLQGLGMTLRIVGAALLLSMLMGLVAAVLRHGSSWVGRGLALLYVALVRNTPLLIQLFAVYFIVAPVLRLSPFWAAVLTLAAFEGAYMTEIFRAGLNSVPQGQRDAAVSLGLPPRHTFFTIILPQSVRRVLPPLTSQTVSLIKDSALVSAIALPDLTMQAQATIAETFLSLELWTLVALIYLVLTLAVSLPALWLEKHFAWRWL